MGLQSFQNYPHSFPLFHDILLNMVSSPVGTHIQATSGLPEWGNQYSLCFSKISLRLWCHPAWDLSKVFLILHRDVYKYRSWKFLVHLVHGSIVKHRLWRQALWNLISSLLIATCGILNTSFYLLGHRIFICKIVLDFKNSSISKVI